MAITGLVDVSDVIVPSIFTQYTQLLTQEKARLIQSGAVVVSPEFSRLLAGGGTAFNVPTWRDLLADDTNNKERVSTDAIGNEFGGAASPLPFEIQTHQEIAVRLERNASWSAADLVEDLAGSDPMAAIGNRVSYYWTRRQQKLFVQIMTGIFLDNDAAPSGTDTHTQFDMTVDISGSAYVPGVTDFSAEAFIDAKLTMGDSAAQLSLIMVHSAVKARMEKNNLIDFIRDSDGNTITTFRDAIVIEDDGMPKSGNVYESWLFGPGAIAFGVDSPAVPTEVQRLAGAGNGGGQTVLYNRVKWCMHPRGNAYIGSTAVGQPTNATLALAASWSRVVPERKQVPIARLKTREA